MASDKQQMDELSGFLGVGSLEILGVFFILDGMSGFLTFIEIYAKTSAWAILVAVPLLVVAYVLGLISSLATRSGAGFVFSKSANTFIVPRSRRIEQCCTPSEIP